MWWPKRRDGNATGARLDGGNGNEGKEGENRKGDYEMRMDEYWTR